MRRLRSLRWGIKHASKVFLAMVSQPGSHLRGRQRRTEEVPLHQAATRLLLEKPGLLDRLHALDHYLQFESAHEVHHRTRYGARLRTVGDVAQERLVEFHRVDWKIVEVAERRV